MFMISFYIQIKYYPTILILEVYKSYYYKINSFNIYA